VSPSSAMSNSGFIEQSNYKPVGMLRYLVGDVDRRSYASCFPQRLVSVLTLHYGLAHYLVFCEAKMHYICFRPGLQPGPQCGSIRRSSRPHSRLQRDTHLAPPHFPPVYFVQYRSIELLTVVVIAIVLV